MSFEGKYRGIGKSVTQKGSRVKYFDATEELVIIKLCRGIYSAHINYTNVQDGEGSKVVTDSIDLVLTKSGDKLVSGSAGFCDFKFHGSKLLHTYSDIISNKGTMDAGIIVFSRVKR